ncbi:MAG: hypothetical protein HY941_12510 [Gammaproteobacteria bacterium]|nr:hypothetical protein [Gammaproteobacteria bacterium]
MTYIAIKRLLYILATTLVFSVCGGALATPQTDENAHYKVVDGVAIYLGVMPAEIIQGHPKDHPETQMHGGPPDTGGRYHVMVALFEQSTGKRIADAQVTATVSPLGFSGSEKKLEHMIVAGATTYGNYYTMSGPGPYRIEIRIKRRNASTAIHVTFEYQQPRG